MGYTSVPNTFTSSTALDPGKVNENFTILIRGMTDGTKDHNVNSLTVAGTATLNAWAEFGSSGSAINYAKAPSCFYYPPPYALEWKDNATVTIKAGDYFIGGQTYTLSGDLDWTWTASGQNRGLDTGAEASDTPYYLYAIVYSGAFGIIASATAPTSLFDTAVTGYTTTTYLGSFMNGSGANITKFTSCGKRTITHFKDTFSTNSASYAEIALRIPESASVAIGHFFMLDLLSATNKSFAISSDGTTDFFERDAEQSIDAYTYLEVPITDQKIYMKTDDGQANFYLIGWIDKWLA